MSEESKMGLFGSKDDKTESTSADTTKQNSPDRYAPYCIDSDSETYDTEALSIMDINDIIGVQTGSGVESTLESEIAALSEMITDSKGDTSSDIMNEIPTESSETEFNEELITDFNSVAASENPIPTINEESLQQDLITRDSKVEDVDENTKDGVISDGIIESSSQELLKVKNDVEITEEVGTEAKDVAVDSFPLNNKEAEPMLEAEAKEYSSVFSEVRNIDDGAQDGEILSTTKDELPTTSDDVTESQIPETESINDTISQVEAHSSEETPEAVQINSADETIKDNIDTSKCEDVAVIQDADMAILNLVKDAEDVDSNLKTHTAEEEIVDDPTDEKSTDVLTNLGSTSKSLQLIGEAYISEDSQEIDETDDSPVVKAPTFSLHSIQEDKKVKEDDEPQEKGNSDDAVTDTLTDESDVIVTAGNLESVVAKCDSDNKDSVAIDNILEADNTKEVSPNLQDNADDCIGQDPNIESKVNVEQKGDVVIDEDESIHQNLHDHGTADKSNELLEIPLAMTVSTDTDSSITQIVTSTQESLESKEEQSSEQSEDIPSNICVETVGMIAENDVLDRGTKQGLEELQEKISEQTKLFEEAVESDSALAMEDDNFSTVASEEMAGKELESSSSIILADSTSESKNSSDLNLEIQVKNIEEKAPEPIQKQDSGSALTESNTKSEIINSENSQESLSNLQPSINQDEVSEGDAKCSILPTEISKSLENLDNQCTTTNESAVTSISAKEQQQHKEISDNIENILKTDTETEKDQIADATVNREDSSHVITNIDNEEREDENKDGSKINNEKGEEKIDSEPSEPHIDETQLEPMESAALTVEETGTNSSNNMDINEENAAIEDNKEEAEAAKDVETGLIQSASTSDMEEDVSAAQIMEAEQPEEDETSNKKLSSDVIEADLLPSEVVQKKLAEEKDDSTVMDTGEQVPAETNLCPTTGSVVPETTSSITNEDMSDSKSTSEDISAINDDLISGGIVESNSSEDDLNKQESIEEPTKPEEISKTEDLDHKTPVEPRISEAENKEVAEREASNKVEQFQEDKPTSELLTDANELQAEHLSDKENTGVEESKSITEPSTEIVCDEAVIPEERTAEISTIQDPFGDESCSKSQTTHDSEPKIQTVEDGQFKSTRQDELSHAIAESSFSDVNSIIVSDSLLDMAAQIQIEKSTNEANLQPTDDNPLNKAKINVPENLVEKSCDPEMEVKESGDVGSELAPKEVSDSLLLEEKLEEEELLPANLVDDKISDDVNRSQSLGENLESNNTPETSSDKNEAEGHSEDSVSNLGPEMKMDEEDLQSQATKELKDLKAKETEMMIDELADAALNETTTSSEKLEIQSNSDSTISTILSSEDSKIATVTNEFAEIEEESASYLGETDEKIFNADLNDTLPSVSHGTDYVTDIMISSTNIGGTQLTDDKSDTDDKNVTADKFEEKIQADIIEADQNLIPDESLFVDENITEIEEKLVLDKNLEITLPLKQGEEKLIECAVFRACGSKIDLPNEEVFDAEDAEQADVLCDIPADNTSQQSSEFSELECAVKFLQESEEQTIDSPLLLSPKIAEEIAEDNSNQSKSCLFLSETEVCQDGSLELPVELEEITPDSIAISEAEIISEAAKLENERKLKIAEEMSKSSEIIEKLDVPKETSSGDSSGMLKSLLTTAKVSSWQQENLASTSEKPENIEIPKLTESIIRRSEKIPKISILEERLKEPPKIEIPVPEGSPRISDTPTTPKTSLLIQRDSRIDTKLMYQKMLESPKSGDKSEPRIVETPRKDSEKYDFENVGSPRIILKIAKSAIADCGEPRSPKSPKIRSAANSPNPEDSPGQKLGKIKLKLSKGGHPSIISNENFDETAQRHTDAILSPSHIGMKIKLSKTGDASIIPSDKHDLMDEIKESKHKYDDHSPKRIDSPLGMKIKLSKTGDPSIVQHDSKESTSKRKDKLDIGQEIPKRTDSPIGMKIKLSKSGDASIIQPEKQESLEDAAYNDKFDIAKEIPKRTESPIGMKIKLSKTGDASIISSEGCEDFKDSSSKSRDKLNANQDIPKRTDSPLGMKFKLSKSGGASIIQPDKPDNFDDFKDKLENTAEITKRIESPIGMKIKLSKTGDASIIHPEKQESDEHRESIIIKHREKSEAQETQKRTDSPIGMRIKVTKTGEASVVQMEEFKDSLLEQGNMESFDMTHDVPKRNESPIGMKIKLSKSGDASIIHPERQESFDSNISQEGSRSTDSPLGMKIKLSKTGDASIIHPETSPECKRTDSPLGMKIKLSKTGDASIIEPDKKEKSGTKQKEKSSNLQEVSQKRKDMEFPLEMKIKLSKTGHPTIIANEKQESHSELQSGQSTHHKHAESTSNKDSQLRIYKTGHSTIIQSSRSEVTIEPVQLGFQKPESSMDISPKSKDIVISPVETKRSKLESKLSHILPEVTIQPVKSGEQQQQQQITLDKKSSSISRQQMSVINQEISITHVPLSKPADLSMSGKLKEILRKNATNSPANSDCEIIEHRPELIIVNENSNSSQDIMIIEEVKAPLLEVKVPRKRGRPKRSTLPPGQPLIRQGFPQDPVSANNSQSLTTAEQRESDRPKRTCRSQKSYAPPKRGRGRGRGKRKMDRADCAIGKIPRLEDPLTAIERSTMSLIAPPQPRILTEPTAQTSELYKALKQSPTERKRMISETIVQHAFPDANKKLRLDSGPEKQLASHLPAELKSDEQLIVKTGLDTSDPKAVMISEMLQFSEPVNTQESNEKSLETSKPDIQENKNIISDMTTTEHQNWLTPSIKLPESTGKTEAISMVQVMDEETRMSAESNSRSQTPARNISIPVVETVINEESQGSVLSTATTESEKVKVRNRRMEINFDPDEGPFTVDKIAEYEWPLDQKGDTFMIQEQISQYLGVKSFKRKYPDLKRRMVEMEERNFLRENILVSEAMCDMGLTAICSTEVLDIMCSDFPDQYEEYRKHMREKQAKEHSKKQKELTAAANAERNRIDLAEMAVQSALSWNVNFNKARKESRKYSLDLQSFTIHVPKKQQKVDAERKASNYPVALIPGQYTDYYREYTPAELRYYPLNTVLYGPMRPNERKFDSQSEGSQSDSDSDSSSDDSSSSSSEGTQDTEESQSTVDDVDMELAAHKEDNKNLKCKMCLRNLNKSGKAEVLIQCGTCNGNVHPSCIDLTLDMVPHIQGYSWQCTDCKTCVQCHNPADEDKMLFCDMCDRGYHIYCVGLRRVPQGRWHCRECAVCASCGLRQPGGANSDRNSVAQWQHEYKKGERNTRVYVSTLCVPCSKLWRKGRYCPHCSRCHSAQRLDLEPSLIHCGACDKYLHLGCVEIRSGTLDRKNYICECCSTPNHQLSRSLMSKNYRT